jgi:very-short-patch-repair endonuclease
MPYTENDMTTFATMIVACGLPEPVEEFRFDPVRRWRFDFAWPERMLALEIEGGTWSGGRHVRGKGYANDCEKYNAACLAGWRVLRFTSGMVRSGEALAVLAEALRETK